jgi:hypothetical protein
MLDAHLLGVPRILCCLDLDLCRFGGERWEWRSSFVGSRHCDDLGDRREQFLYFDDFLGIAMKLSKFYIH